MIQRNILSNKRKRERLKVNNLNDFKDALKKEGYKIDEVDEEKFKEKTSEIFKVDKSIIERLYICISEPDITYRANDVKDLINYMREMMLFENEHNKLCKKISTIKTLIIDRIEYEREPSFQDNVQDMVDDIEKIASEISKAINEEDKIKLEELEKELNKEYLYTKDIELLKKMILVRNEEIEKTYNDQTKIKTVTIKVPKRISYEYIKARKGTVEYHEYLSNNIPRMQRLIKNMNKYMKIDEKEKTIFKIDQSKTLQDSINIAVAIYDQKEFRAISGSNDIENYYKSTPAEEAAFKSSKTNKLGKLGIGYNRINDSEKKIFEEIHKQIEKKALKNEGDLVLYSKWEPCPSCYSVINQFRKKHPNIKVQVRYIKRYGEQ